MTQRFLLFGSVLMLLPRPSLAQTATERIQGLRDATSRWHVLTGVRLFVAPGRVIENGMPVVKDGLVVAAGAAGAVPEGERVWRLPGRSDVPRLHRSRQHDRRARRAAAIGADTAALGAGFRAAGTGRKARRATAAARARTVGVEPFRSAGAGCRTAA